MKHTGDEDESTIRVILIALYVRKLLQNDLKVGYKSCDYVLIALLTSEKSPMSVVSWRHNVKVCQICSVRISGDVFIGVVVCSMSSFRGLAAVQNALSSCTHRHSVYVLQPTLTHTQTDSYTKVVNGPRLLSELVRAVGRGFNISVYLKSPIYRHERL